MWIDQKMISNHSIAIGEYPNFVEQSPQVHPVHSSLPSLFSFCRYRFWSNLHSLTSYPGTWSSAINITIDNVVGMVIARGDDAIDALSYSFQFKGRLLHSVRLVLLNDISSELLPVPQLPLLCFVFRIVVYAYRLIPVGDWLIPLCGFWGLLLSPDMLTMGREMFLRWINRYLIIRYLYLMVIFRATKIMDFLLKTVSLNSKLSVKFPL